MEATTTVLLWKRTFSVSFYLLSNRFNNSLELSSILFFKEVINITPFASQKIVAIYCWTDGIVFSILGFTENNPLFWLLHAFRCMIMNPSLIENDNSMQKLYWISLKLLKAQLRSWKPYLLVVHQSRHTSGLQLFV